MSLLFISYFLLILFSVCIIYTDYKFKKIPNKLIIPFFFIGLILTLLNTSNLSNFLIWFFIILFLIFVFLQYTNILGGGDAKAILVIFTILPFCKKIFFSVFVFNVIATSFIFVFLAMLLFYKTKSSKNKFIEIFRNKIKFRYGIYLGISSILLLFII